MLFQFQLSDSALFLKYHKFMNSESLVFVSKTTAVALYPKNQPLAVPGLTTIVFPTFWFCTLCV